MAVQPFVRPNRFGKLVCDTSCIGMNRIDEDIAFDPSRDRWHEQQRTAPFPIPDLAKLFADRLVPGVPARMPRGLEHFVAHPVRDGDADVVLVGRQDAVGMHQLLQHCRGIVLRCVNHRARLGIPAPRKQARSFCVVDRVGSSRLADTKTGEDTIRPQHAHTPPL